MGIERTYLWGGLILLICNSVASLNVAMQKPSPASVTMPQVTAQDITTALNNAMQMMNNTHMMENMLVRQYVRYLITILIINYYW